MGEAWMDGGREGGMGEGGREERKTFHFTIQCKL